MCGRNGDSGHICWQTFCSGELKYQSCKRSMPISTYWSGLGNVLDDWFVFLFPSYRLVPCSHIEILQWSGRNTCRVQQRAQDWHTRWMWKKCSRWASKIHDHKPRYVWSVDRGWNQNTFKIYEDRNTKQKQDETRYNYLIIIWKVTGFPSLLRVIYLCHSVDKLH